MEMLNCLMLNDGNSSKENYGKMVKSHKTLYETSISRVKLKLRVIWRLVGIHSVCLYQKHMN